MSTNVKEFRLDCELVNSVGYRAHLLIGHGKVRIMRDDEVTMTK